LSGDFAPLEYSAAILSPLSARKPSRLLSANQKPNEHHAQCRRAKYYGSHATAFQSGNDGSNREIRKIRERTGRATRTGVHPLVVLARKAFLFRVFRVFRGSTCSWSIDGHELVTSRRLKPNLCRRTGVAPVSDFVD